MSQKPFRFLSGAFTDTTVKITVFSFSSSTPTITINGSDYTPTMVARCEDGEGGFEDSGDQVGLEVGIYSVAQTITGLSANTAYPFSVTQDGETITGQTNTNPGGKFTMWAWSCWGYAQGTIPTSTDRSSVGMAAVIRADAENNPDRPLRAILHPDDVGYPDGSQLKDTLGDGTGRFTGVPQDQDSAYVYAQIYATMFGLMGDYVATGATISNPGFLQVRYSNDDFDWLMRNAPYFAQTGDHNYRGDQGGSLKLVQTYINARKAWDATWGLNNPTILDETDPTGYAGNGTAFVHRIGPVLTVWPDREWNSSGPTATAISSITVGATTTVETTDPHYFKVAGQKCLLSGVSGSPDINDTYYVIDSITDANTIVIQLDSAGNGPYSGGTVEGLELIKSVVAGGTGRIGNGDSEQYLGNGQIDDILAAVESDGTATFCLMCSPMELSYYQSPISVMDQAAIDKANDPLNYLGPSRYGSQQPLGGFDPDEHKRLMTQDASGGNAAQGIAGKCIRKGMNLAAVVGDHHHCGIKVIYRPPADSTSDWFRMMQFWTGSVNASTSAQEMHQDCLTKWKSHNCVSLYRMPIVNTLTPAQEQSGDYPLPLDATKPINAIRIVVNGASSIEFTIFNERGEIVTDDKTGKLMQTTMYAGQSNIPEDLGFLAKAYSTVSVEDGIT